MNASDEAEAGPRSGRTLRTQLTLFSLGLVLPTALVATVLIAWNVAEGRRSAEQALLATARASAAAIDQDLARQIALAEAIASSDALASRDWPAVAARIARLNLGPDTWVAISDRYGRRLLNTAPEASASSAATLAARPANIMRALQAHEVQVSDLFTGATTRRRVVAVDAPAIGDPDAVVVSLIMAPQRFLSILRDQPLPTDAFTTVIGSDRRVIIRSKSPEKFLGVSATETMIRALDERAAGVVPSRSLDGSQTLVGYAPSSLSGWTTMVVIPRDDFEAPIWQAVSVVLAVFGALMLASLFFARRQSRLITAEMEGLAEDARVVSAGGLVSRRASSILDVDRVQEAFHDASVELHRRGERQSLLINELNHRVKNTLATVQALAVQTFRGGEMAKVRTFEERLVALSGAHDLLTRSTWSAVEIHDILGRCGDQLDGRIVGDGPAVMLAPEAALALCMILHELQTNSLKYGALSWADGIVRVAWAESTDEIDFSWREIGGPPVKEPTRKGFGTRLIDRLVQTDLGGRIVRDFRPEGLIVTCRFNPAGQGRWNSGL
ncbi:MAG: sensor histidine kinase [Oxalobacteraceae bacterium]|nr:MAG: sensor histidine kinase [Oxalobacteraceae bacterium]